MQPRRIMSAIFGKTLFLCFSFVLALSIHTTLLADNGLPEKPTQEGYNISKGTALLLNYAHVSKREMDDEMSRRTFKTFINALDPFKVYFLQSDIDSFKAYETHLDDQIKKGDINFAFTTFRKYLERVDQRVKTVEKILAGELDFEKVESYVTKPELRSYPKNAEEANSLWKRRLKYDLLVEIANKKELAESKEKILKRYKRFKKQMDSTDQDELLEMYITAMTTSYDPHSTYMSAHTLENFQINMKLELEGIGASLRAEDGYTTIIEVLPGGAAALDGRLKAGDKIIGVANDGSDDFIDLVEMKLSDVVSKIRGKAGTKVRLQVQTATNGEVKIYDIIRAKVELKESAAQGQVFESGKKADGSAYRVGVIDLPSFYRDMSPGASGRDNIRSTTTDVRNLIEEFKQGKGVDTIILDLSRNGGGALVEAVDLTGLFIDVGPVVQVKDMNGKVMPRVDTHRGLSWEGPLVVLTSKFSASASEILAGALQDYGRAVVVGDSMTHGKGTVQTLLDIGDQFAERNAPNWGALKVTIQQFYRPNGASTQNRGVLADVVLPALTDHLDVGEADLDYPLEWGTVASAKFIPTGNVDKAAIDKLKAQSSSRVSSNKDFQKVERNIARYLERKKRTELSINKKTFLADRKALEDVDENLKKEEEESASSERKIKRDFYLEEAMNIAIDLAKIARDYAVNN